MTGQEILQYTSSKKVHLKNAYISLYMLVYESEIYNEIKEL